MLLALLDVLPLPLVVALLLVLPDVPVLLLPALPLLLFMDEFDEFWSE